MLCKIIQCVLGYTLRFRLLYDLYTNRCRPEVFKHIETDDVYNQHLPCCQLVALEDVFLCVVSL